MLGFVSENVPKSGALGLAIMGGIGFLSASIVTPMLGIVYDFETVQAIPEGYIVEILTAAAEGTKEAALWAEAKLTGGTASLRYVAFFALILVFLFGYLYATRKSRKIEALDNTSE